MKVSKIVAAMETIAPTSDALEWDNVGLLLGDAAADVRKVLVCIDMTEGVLAEAVKAGAKMIIAYHPVIYKSVTRVTAEDSPPLWSAARKGISVYCPHTALDIAKGGTNDVLADIMGMDFRRPLSTSEQRQQCKIVAFVPTDDLSTVADAAFAAGAGKIGNYERCAFFGHGIGTFQGSSQTRPTVGQTGRQEATEELRLEFVAATGLAGQIVQAIRSAHSYEEPAVDVYPLESSDGVGLGRVGSLTRAVNVNTLINRIKQAIGIDKVLLAKSEGEISKSRSKKKSSRAAQKVVTVACAAGCCGKLYLDAISAGATFYLTGEMQHHEALNAAQNGLTCLCLGHSNSERIALKAMIKNLKQNLPKIPIILSKTDKDPFIVV